MSHVLVGSRIDCCCKETAAIVLYYHTSTTCSLVPLHGNDGCVYYKGESHVFVHNVVYCNTPPIAIVCVQPG